MSTSEDKMREQRMLSPDVRRVISSYWRRNVALMLTLLVIWAGVGLGCGVLFADRLNEFHLGGFPLGFWFAQQGSIIVFVALILMYAIGMSRLDRRHHVELELLRRSEAETLAGKSNTHARTSDAGV